VFYVFLVLRHDRRRVVYFNVTSHSTAQWAAQQIVEAFPFDDIRVIRAGHTRDVQGFKLLFFF
jgi:hypothetical protein